MQAQPIRILHTCGHPADAINGYYGAPFVPYEGQPIDWQKRG